MFDPWALLLVLALAWAGLALAVGLWLGPRIRRSVGGTPRPDRLDVEGTAVVDGGLEAVADEAPAAPPLAQGGGMGAVGPEPQRIMAARTALDPNGR